jgi:hypothetical protein
MIPVSSVIPNAVAAMLRRAPLTPEKVAFAWRMAVGPAVDRVTSVELVDDVLRVRTRDAAWRREIDRSANLIRARLQTLLGHDTVRTIRTSARPALADTPTQP